MSSPSNVTVDLPAARERALHKVDDSRAVPVPEGYERWAPIYDADPNPLLACEERYLLPLLTDLRDKSVLDLACGTGRWLERLMAQGCESGVGIDRSIAMLRIAERKRAIRGRLARAGCEDLPLPNAAFDLAICSFALGHIRDMGPMVRELGRVMKPGADVFVSDLHPEAYAHGWRVGFRDASGAIQIEARSRSVQEIVGAFCSHDFQSLKQESVWLSEPEQPFFLQAGKSHVFVEACQLPAVLVCHFKRTRSAVGEGLSSKPGQEPLP